LALPHRSADFKFSSAGLLIKLTDSAVMSVILFVLKLQSQTLLIKELFFRKQRKYASKKKGHCRNQDSDHKKHVQRTKKNRLDCGKRLIRGQSDLERRNIANIVVFETGNRLG
jgi:hypothetical protein